MEHKSFSADGRSRCLLGPFAFTNQSGLVAMITITPGQGVASENEVSRSGFIAKDFESTLRPVLHFTDLWPEVDSAVTIVLARSFLRQNYWRSQALASVTSWRSKNGCPDFT
jgi:hypothetical protein